MLKETFKRKSMIKKYFITLEHYKRMFELEADNLAELCSSEKPRPSDIVYGFRLGQDHSFMRDCFLKMMELEEEIRKQNE